MDTTLIPYAPPLSPMQIAASAADASAVQSSLENYHRKIAAHTLRRVKADIALFGRYLAAAGIPTGDLFETLEAWCDVSFGLVAGFREWQIAEGYAMGSVNVRLATVKKYARLTRLANLMSAEQFEAIVAVETYQDREAENVDANRGKTHQTRRSTKKDEPTQVHIEHIHALREQLASDQSFYGKRDSALVCLLGYQGLRCGEVASLRVQDIALATGTFTIYRQKVHLTQTHKLHVQTRSALKAYLDVAHPTDKLFMGVDRDAYNRLSDGKLCAAHTAADGLSTRAIGARIRHLGTLVGIVNPPLSPHDLRHFWTKDLFLHGTPIDVVKDAGGWSDYKMPMHYRGQYAIANKGVKQST